MGAGVQAILEPYQRNHSGPLGASCSHGRTESSRPLFLFFFIPPSLASSTPPPPIFPRLDRHPCALLSAPPATWPVLQLLASFARSLSPSRILVPAPSLARSHYRSPPHPLPPFFATLFPPFSFPSLDLAASQRLLLCACFSALCPAPHRPFVSSGEARPPPARPLASLAQVPRGLFPSPCPGFPMDERRRCLTSRGACHSTPFCARCRVGFPPSSQPLPQLRLVSSGASGALLTLGDACEHVPSATRAHLPPPTR